MTLESGWFGTMLLEECFRSVVNVFGCTPPVGGGGCFPSATAFLRLAGENVCPGGLMFLGRLPPTRLCPCFSRLVVLGGSLRAWNCVWVSLRFPHTDVLGLHL